MPVISFANPKGGVGKTTAATLVASELAMRGATVTVIEADPNKHLKSWFSKGGLPPGLSVIDEVNEENILEEIEKYAALSKFVIVDLEGIANQTGAYAIAASDLCVIPMQGSQLDATQAGRQLQLVRRQEKLTRRRIPAYVLFTRTNPVIRPKTLTFIEDSLQKAEIPILETALTDREAYRAIFSYGGTVHGLAERGVSPAQVQSALTNVRELVVELIEIIRKHQPERAAS